MSGFLEHIASDGERWDNIAYQYYGDAMNYEVIITANPQLGITPNLKAGQVVRVPIIEEIAQPTEDLPPWLR